MQTRQLGREKWLAVRVKSGRESAVKSSLEWKGYEVFLPAAPSVKWRNGSQRKILEPLFSGYLFCHVDPLVRLPILKAPSVLDIVSFARVPMPVDDWEIDNLRTVLERGAVCRPWPFTHTGQLVRIKRGPLYGVEGKLVDLGDFDRKGRVVLSITLLQRSVSVEIDADSLIPVGGDGPLMAYQQEAASLQQGA